MTDLTGKRVVITAGGAGIGAAMARSFARAGAKVALCDIDGDGAKAVASDLSGAMGMGADVTNEAQMTAFLAAAQDHLGGVDVLCANAGTGGPVALVDEISLEDWRACVAVNLDGAFLACRWAAPLMRAQGSGVMLLTSSTSGFWGVPTRSPYVAAKWAVLGLMKTLAMELGPHGVRVNALCPGAVEGDRMDRVVAGEAGRTRNGPGGRARALCRRHVDGPLGHGRRHRGYGGLSGLAAGAVGVGADHRGGWAYGADDVIRSVMAGFACAMPQHKMRDRPVYGLCRGLCLADSRTCSAVRPFFGCHERDENGQIQVICID